MFKIVLYLRSFIQRKNQICERRGHWTEKRGTCVRCKAVVDKSKRGV